MHTITFGDTNNVRPFTREQKDDIQRIACCLLSDEGENPEYDRAIGELTAELIGLPLEYADALRERLKRTRKAILGI